MKKFIILAVILVCAACSNNPEKQKSPLKVGPLPVTDYSSHLDFNGRGLEIWVMPHGWLIYNNRGFAGGLAFVPKPDTQ